MSQPRFAVVPSTVLFDATLPPASRLLYALLASYAQGGRGMVWPEQSTLADALTCSDRSVQRALQPLVAAGIVTVSRLRRVDGSLDRNEYELHGFEHVIATTTSSAKAQPCDTSVAWSPGDTSVAWSAADNLATEQSKVDPQSHRDHATLVSRLVEQNKDLQDTLKTRSKRFVAPTADEVAHELWRRGWDDADEALLEAHAFVGYHEARGWVVGRVAMRSWLGALTYWLRNKVRFDAERAERRGAGNRFDGGLDAAIRRRKG